MEESTALYIEISKQIMQDIQLGAYPENSSLPKEETLCKKYNVGRTTIRRALDLLKDAGAIFSVQGNGTYIKPHLYTQPLSSFYSFTDTLKSSNILIQNKVIDCEIIAADRSLARKTHYAVGTKFHKLLRLRSAREYPLMLEMTYLPQSRFWALDTATLSRGSLYDYLRKQYNFHAERATEVFQPVMPRPDEKALLHISSSTPCMLLERYSYEDDAVIEYTKSIVRGDKYAFRIELEQNAVVHPAFE